MSATLQIKRSQVTATPPSLAIGELAYSEASDTLFIGVTGPAVYAIAGAGLFAKLASPTFTGTPNAPTPTTSDNSTQIATTAFVKAQSYLTANQGITLSGDASGTGTTAITVTLASIVTPGTGTKLTYDAKGRVTGSASLVAADVPKTLDHTWVTDFDAQVRTSRLDQMAAPTSPVALNSQRITGLAAPSSANDAATKAYVDAVKQGLSVKDSARALAVANVTISGTQTIDGVALVAGDRVLLTAQTTGSQNGVWLVASGSWTRPADFDGANGDVSEGAFIFVAEGTLYASTGWVLTTTGTITIGSTSLAFTQFSGAGGITTGNGLTKSGSQISAVGVSGQITVGVGGIGIDSSYVGQTSITTLGTIATGVWSGTAISPTKGGTGLTSYATGDLPYASGTNTLSKLAAGTNGKFLVMAAGIPAWTDTVDGGSF